MKAKHQRLTLAAIAVFALTGSALLAMSALKDQAAYFYSPSDIARLGSPPQNEAARLGGMVMANSIRRAADGVTIEFVLEDGPHQVPVRFRGITPDLFKEKSGAVAEGRFEGNVFVADNILAKHDERYVPPQMAGGQHKTETLEP